MQEQRESREPRQIVIIHETEPGKDRFPSIIKLPNTISVAIWASIEAVYMTGASISTACVEAIYNNLGFVLFISTARTVFGPMVRLYTTFMSL